jgi:hypothetical protein
VIYQINYYFFYILWAALLFGGAGLRIYTGEFKITFIGNILSSVVLLVIAHKQTRDTLSAFPKLVCWGMFFGLLGDVAMSSGIVLAGMLLFGVGHVYYIRSLRYEFKSVDIAPVLYESIALRLLLIAGLAAWYFIVFKGEGTRAAESKLLVYAALPYTILLSATAGIACGYALRLKHLRYFAVGACLFLLSDIIIAMRMFRPEFYQMIPELIRSEAVWLTYGPAQFLIVYSARSKM